MICKRFTYKIIGLINIKHITVVAVILLMVACAQPKRENDMMKSEVATEAAAMDAKEDFQYQNISKQKLQDLYDLLVLQQNHPEFKKDIANQLQDISEDSIHISNKMNTISVENVSILEPIRQLSDSTQSLKIDFDVNSNLGVTKDSITVIITTNKIIIDEQELKSTKIRFKKIN